MGLLYNPKKTYEDEFAPIPVGDYVVLIEKIEKKESSAGNEYMNLTLRVKKGKQKNRCVFAVIMLSENWLSKWQQLFNATGIKIPKFDLTNEKQLQKVILNAVVCITVYHEEKNKRVNERIAQYYKATKEDIEAVNEAEEFGTEVDDDEEFDSFIEDGEDEEESEEEEEDDEDEDEEEEEEEEEEEDEEPEPEPKPKKKVNKKALKDKKKKKKPVDDDDDIPL